MEQSFGAALRALREARGLSIRALARTANCSPAAVGHAETGRRPPTPELATAFDRALGTAPLLTTMLDERPGRDDQADRRTLLGQLAAVAGSGAAAHPEAVAEAVRAEILAALDGDTGGDWAAVVARHSRALINAPTPALEVRVLADLALARHGVARGDRDATRAAAHLTLLHGQCKADRGDAAAAATWYATAVTIADRSGDTRLSSFVRGRQAVRLNYEDGDEGVLFGAAGGGLALSSKPSIGTLECHVAVAAARARRGDRSARESMDTYTGLAEVIEPDFETGYDPVARVLYSRTYVLSRIGDLPAVEAAYVEAAAGGLPAIWRAHAALNLAHGMVRAGEVAEGVRRAAAVVGAVPRHHRIRIFGQLVAELVAAMPAAQWTRADVRALRALAKG